MTGPACATRICGCSAASGWCRTRASSRCADIAALGPDPLNDGIDVDRLKDRLARTRLPIKVAILDQTLLPGVGNIQASEGLFRAGIDPRRPARSLSRAELARLARGLLESIRYTLRTFKHSGADGADADIDYVEERKIPNPFVVYARAGEPCPRLCAANVEAAVTAGSSCGSCRHSGRRSTARGASADRASRVTPSIATSPADQHPSRQQVLSGGAGADQARAAPARDEVAFQSEAGQVLAADEVEVLDRGRVRRAEDVQRPRRRRADQRRRLRRRQRRGRRRFGDGGAATLGRQAIVRRARGRSDSRRSPGAGAARRCVTRPRSARR